MVGVCRGQTLSARHSLLPLYLLSPQQSSGPERWHYFRVAETEAQKVKKLAQEHTASKWQSPNPNPRPPSS